MMRWLVRVQIMPTLEMAIHEINKRLIPTHDLDQTQWVLLQRELALFLAAKCYLLHLAKKHKRDATRREDVRM